MPVVAQKGTCSTIQSYDFGEVLGPPLLQARVDTEPLHSACSFGITVGRPAAAGVVHLKSRGAFGAFCSIRPPPTGFTPAGRPAPGHI